MCVQNFEYTCAHIIIFWGIMKREYFCLFFGMILLIFLGRYHFIGLDLGVFFMHFRVFKAMFWGCLNFKYCFRGVKYLIYIFG